MAQDVLGTVLAGNADVIRKERDVFDQQPVDWDLLNGSTPQPHRRQRTIAQPVSVAGPGTFFGKATRTVRFEPTDMAGWWFSREDRDDSLPVCASIRNVWTTSDVVSNIVIRSGSPHNYIRMVEHIIALKLGMGLDNLMIKMESGDPPLFKRGSLDLIEALESAGIQESDKPVSYVTVKEKVTIGSSSGSFITFEPCAGREPALTMDCAIDFPTAIGRQRIRVPLLDKHFKYGAEARTNTSFIKMLYCRTIGKLFADVRNLGYTNENILIASRFGYANEPKLIHEEKSLEAVWHRTMLDLLAAVALIENGRFAGHITSYKAGHTLDCQAIRLLYKHGLLVNV